MREDEPVAAERDTPTRLFSSLVRTDPSPREEESCFEFLDRVADPVFGRVRELLERWLSAFPEEDRRDLAGRLTSGDDSQFDAAWFELYVFTTMQAIGHEVSIHPEMADVRTRPDMRVGRRPESLLIEATVIGDGDAARRRRRSRVTAAFERLECTDFALILSIDAETSTAPPMRDVRRRTDRWLRSLDADRERTRLTTEGPDHLPSRTDGAGGCPFTLRAVPRPPGGRGPLSRAVMAGPADGGSFDHVSTIRERLRQKAQRYGDSDEPLLLAVRLDGVAVSTEDVASALYGPTVGRAVAGARHTVATGHRGDGLWHRSERCRNARVLGVLVCSAALRPWSVARVRPTLWLAPGTGGGGSDRTSPRLPFDTVRLVDGHPTRTTGTFVPTEVFALPDGTTLDPGDQWPGDPFARGAPV